ncbi:MAG: hypothetical protein WBI63_01955, partial [Coriobacteriia bacterium]
MNVNVKEFAFECDIEGVLLSGGPDAIDGDSLALEDPAVYGEWIPGGYRHRTDADFDRETLVLTRDLIDFVITS